MNKEQFIEKLKKIKKVESTTGRAVYLSIEISDNNKKILFKRNDEFRKFESIYIDEMFKLYSEKNISEINTTVAKEYITNQKQSPAVAILLEVGRLE